jgi:DNA-binding MarR family transcriptional regulator
MKMAKKQPQSPSDTDDPMDERDYRNLALFRRTLRGFLAFSEQAARKAGLTPQQHQAILAVRGLGLEQGMTVGELASHLLLKPQTAVGLVDRLVEAGFISRVQDEDDRRRVLLKLTAKAEKALKALSVTHMTELRRDAPALIGLLKNLSAE